MAVADHRHPVYDTGGEIQNELLRILRRRKAVVKNNTPASPCLD